MNRLVKLNPVFLALLLASAASLVELAPIARLLATGHGLAAILGAGLAYQIGNALQRWPKAQTTAVLLATITLGALGLLILKAGEPWWYLSLACSSWALQGTRRRLSLASEGHEPSTPQKRTARVLGFVVATIMPLGVVAIALWTATICGLGFARKAVEAQAQIEARRKLSALEVIMTLHQSHYFAYCYALPLLFSAAALGGVAWIGLWFALGWVSYLSAEWLWRRFNPTTTFLVGHVSLTILLLVMATVLPGTWATIGLWLASGLGGGTVYCISILHRRACLAHRRLELAEDIGHLLGVLISLAVVVFLGWSAPSLAALGAAWAFAAFVGMAALALKNTRKHLNQPEMESEKS